MENGSSMSPADFAALSNGGFGGWGNGFEGLIYLAVIASMFGGWGGFGGGWGGNSALMGMATQNDVQRGFDNQNLQAQTRDILAAVNDASARGVAATNQVYHDVVGNLGDKYMELARDVAGVAAAVQGAAANDRECCCEIKQLVQQTSAATQAQAAQFNYESAMRDAATNANLVKEIQGLKDMVQQNKIEALQGKVNELQLAQATAGMLKFPNTWAYGAGPFPPIFGGCPGAVNM